MKMGQPVYYARGSGKLQHLVPLPKGVGLPCEAIPELRITFSIVTVLVFPVVLLLSCLFPISMMLISYETLQIVNSFTL